MPHIDTEGDAPDAPYQSWHASSWALRAGLDVHDGDMHEWQSCRDALQRLAPIEPASGEAR